MLVEKEILWARKIPRNEFLDKRKSQVYDSKLTFNVTYYPVFRHVKPQLKVLLVILACDEEYWFLVSKTEFKFTFRESCPPRYY